MSEGNSGFGRGLNFLMTQRAKNASSGGDWVPKLYVSKDGAVARYRNLVDKDGIFTHNFHEVDQTTRSGKTWQKDVVCTRRITIKEGDDEVTYIDGPEACTYCNREEPLQSWWKGVTWVYVYRIFYLEKVNDKCVPAKRGTGADEVMGFVDEVNAVWFMPLKGIIAEQVSGAAGTYGTLLGRDYELKRNGKANPVAPFYSIYGLDPSEPDAAVQKALDELPDLEEAVLKEFSIQTKPATPAGDPVPTPPTEDGAPHPAAAADDEGPRAPAPKDDQVVKF